jgi:HSP90 family molecular chaperone
MTGKFGIGFLATHLLLERVKVKAYLKDEDEPLNI